MCIKMANYEVNKSISLNTVAVKKVQKNAGSETSGKKSIARLRAFCQDTSAHGLGQVGKKDNKIHVRFVWFAVFLCAFAVNISHVVTLVLRYLEYSTHEVIAVSESSPPFPSVTMCNSVAFSQESVQQALSRGAVNQSDLSVFTALVNEYIDEGLLSQGVKMRLLSDPGWFANVNRSELSDLGHKLDDLIISCRYKGELCDAHSLKRYVYPNYMNCYTFQDIGSEDAGPGPSNGLSVVFYLENLYPRSTYEEWDYNLLSPVANSFGAVVEVHQANALPSPMLEGLQISPGQSTSMILTPTRVMRLQMPYGECTSQKLLDDKSTYSYTTARCIDTCIFAATYNKCGCHSVLYPYAYETNDTNSAHWFCETLRRDERSLAERQQNAAHVSQNINCAYKIWLKYSRDANARKRCGCSEQCTYTKYDAAVSSNQWPGEMYMGSMFQKLVLGSDHANRTSAYRHLNDLYEQRHLNSSKREFERYVSVNFARLNIYFNDVTMLERKQVESETLRGLWSSIGGALGLWTGISVVTIVEICVLICGLCKINCWSKVTRIRA